MSRHSPLWTKKMQSLGKALPGWVFSSSRINLIDQCVQQHQLMV